LKVVQHREQAGDQPLSGELAELLGLLVLATPEVLELRHRAQDLVLGLLELALQSLVLGLKRLELRVAGLSLGGNGRFRSFCAGLDALWCVCWIRLQAVSPLKRVQFYLPMAWLGGLARRGDHGLRGTESLGDRYP